jgi:hypothetical protein
MELEMTNPEDVEVEELDLEDWAKKNPNQRPPLCRRYRIRVDKSRFVVSDSAMKGFEILALVGYKPSKWNLAQKFAGGRREPVDPDQLIDFREPGIERFETSPKEVQAGDSAIVREFILPPEDVEFLDTCGYRWEALQRGSQRGIVLRSFLLPAGLIPSEVDLLIRIPPQYPVAALDMFYLSPGASRTDGRPIVSLTSEEFGGVSWQRWSRHRLPEQIWRPGVDNISTHLQLVAMALKADATKVA